MTSLDLDEAAAFLGIHPDTLAARARAGIIPGGKPGKEWRFLLVDLTTYLRSLYPCHSINAPARPSGTSTSAGLAAPDFDAALAQAIARKRSDSTTSSRRRHGANGKAANVLPMHSRPGSLRKSAAAKS